MAKPITPPSHKDLLYRVGLETVSTDMEDPADRNCNELLHRTGDGTFWAVEYLGDGEPTISPGQYRVKQVLPAELPPPTREDMVEDMVDRVHNTMELPDDYNDGSGVVVQTNVYHRKVDDTYWEESYYDGGGLDFSESEIQQVRRVEAMALQVSFEPIVKARND